MIPIHNQKFKINNYHSSFLTFLTSHFLSLSPSLCLDAFHVSRPDPVVFAQSLTFSRLLLFTSDFPTFSTSILLLSALCPTCRGVAGRAKTGALCSMIKLFQIFDLLNYLRSSRLPSLIPIFHFLFLPY